MILSLAQFKFGELINARNILNLNGQHLHISPFPKKYNSRDISNKIQHVLSNWNYDLLFQSCLLILALVFIQYGSNVKDVSKRSPMPYNINKRVPLPSNFIITQCKSSWEKSIAFAFFGTITDINASYAAALGIYTVSGNIVMEDEDHPHGISQTM